MKKIYFAHPVNVYDEPLEGALLKFIARRLTGGDRGLIENPNQPHHQQGYKQGGMIYFYERVLPQCGGCVALPFLDGRLGLGVASEARWFLERAKSVRIIFPVHPPTLRILTDAEEALLMRDDSLLVVPREETRLRTWLVYNKKKRPYGSAHLARMPIPEGFYPPMPFLD